MDLILKNLEEIYENSIQTIENETYENLEPWIQWYSVFSGKPYKNHKIFRLGDGLRDNNENLFSKINNELKYSCGAVSPMNISSKSADFDFFLPDPWSNEKTIGSFSLNLISEALKQGVNDNSGNGLSLKNKLGLIYGLISNLKFNDIKDLFKFYKQIKNYSFRKALFLDYILCLLHIRLTNKFQTNFSSVFFNAGAHIQHHYFFNSKVKEKKFLETNPQWYISEELDPLEEAIVFYDKIIGLYKEFGFRIILLTGLQQIPYPKKHFYYRLSNHKKFLETFNIPFKIILPRMTRDFEIIFDDNYDRDKAKEILENFVDKKRNKIFGEIDLRNKSIFCTLTYEKEIKKNEKFYFQNKDFILYDQVNFVAIKNGMHEKHGILYFSDKSFKNNNKDIINLEKVKDLIIKNI